MILSLEKTQRRAEPLNQVALAKPVCLTFLDLPGSRTVRHLFLLLINSLLLPETYWGKSWNRAQLSKWLMVSWCQLGDCSIHFLVGDRELEKWGILWTEQEELLLLSLRLKLQWGEAVCHAWCCLLWLSAVRREAIMGACSFRQGERECACLCIYVPSHQEPWCLLLMSLSCQWSRSPCGLSLQQSIWGV